MKSFLLLLYLIPINLFAQYEVRTYENDSSTIFTMGKIYPLQDAVGIKEKLYLNYMEAIIPSSNNRVCMIYFYVFGNVGNTISKLKDVKQISIYYEEGFCVTLDATNQKNEAYKIEGRSNLFVYSICINNAYNILRSNKVKSFNFATSNNQIFSFANFNDFNGILSSFDATYNTYAFNKRNLENTIRVKRIEMSEYEQWEPKLLISERERNVSSTGMYLQTTDGHRELEELPYAKIVTISYDTFYKSFTLILQLKEGGTSMTFSKVKDLGENVVLVFEHRGVVHKYSCPKYHFNGQDLILKLIESNDHSPAHNFRLSNFRID